MMTDLPVFLAQQLRDAMKVSFADVTDCIDYSVDWMRQYTHDFSCVTVLFLIVCKENLT